VGGRRDSKTVKSILRTGPRTFAEDLIGKWEVEGPSLENAKCSKKKSLSSSRGSEGPREGNNSESGLGCEAVTVGRNLGWSEGFGRAWKKKGGGRENPGGRIQGHPRFED